MSIDTHDLAIYDVVQVAETHPELADCLGVVKEFSTENRVVIVLAIPGFFGSTARKYVLRRDEVGNIRSTPARIPIGC